VARGQYLVLMNNDAVVTHSRLEQFISLMGMKADSTTEGTERTEGEREKEREGTTNLTKQRNRRAARLTPGSGRPRMEERLNQPRMNTDLHGWDSGTQPSAGAAASSTHNFNLPSNPCSIRVQSVA
jgi:hypothetical protein